jgi:hypothetical protein
MYATEKKCIQDFGGKEIKPLGRPTCRWKGSIKMYLTEI